MMLKQWLVVGALALLSVVPALAQEDSFDLTILHTNDTHAAHESNANGDGGVARQATVVKQVRDEGGNVVLIDAGDRFTGSLFHQQYRGADQVRIMNLLDYDVMTLGNHEFDDGEDVLLNFASGVNFPVLGANIEFGATFPELDELIQSYTILDVNGQQVGIIGLTTPDTVVTSSPDKAIVFNDDLADAVQQGVDALTEAGVNKIILVTHLGVELELALLEQLSGVDIVLGGHSHTLFANAYTAGEGRAYPTAGADADGSNIYYAQAGERNQYVGLMNVTFDAEGVVTAATGDVIFLSRYITPDPEMTALVEELAGPIAELRATEIGATANVFLVGDRTVCRVEECLLGNLITDALRAETGAQIAITNGGGIRADIDAGAITLGEVLTVLPFGNLASTFDLSGAAVVESLENGVSRVAVENGMVSRAGANGRFPQVSGIRFTFDPTQEAGSRILSVEVLGADGEYAPIDEDAIYTVASNDFMRLGGDGYTAITDNATNVYDFGKPLDQVLAEYLTSLGDVNVETEGRIILEGAELPPIG
ncbi:MAG: 5'-nucleotidase C-terminal domain-containing protein [Chloroflexota bacterium]|nr:5'-nucleotidase C-terminal domain-containing protein [Chloroflexota bacterium]